MKYEQRIVAFIDILGFRTLLNETLDKNNDDIETNIDNLISAYDIIRSNWDLDRVSSVNNQNNSKQVSIFSDSIVVSFKVDEPSQVFYTLLEIQHLIIELLNRKILSRGAVVVGKFIHTQEFLFGPALVEAYTLESKAAMYPRIILDKSVIDAGIENSSVGNNPNEEQTSLESILEQDSDGMYYIDYFLSAYSEIDEPEYGIPKHIENLGDIIRSGLKGSSHHSKADIRVKYSWMRERYNRMIEILKDKKNIKALKDSGNYSSVDYIKSLKKISPNKFKDTFKPKKK